MNKIWFIFIVKPWLNNVSKFLKEEQFKYIKKFTALGIFRRFYLKNNIMEANPILIMKASIILAAKIEEVNFDY